MSSRKEGSKSPPGKRKGDKNKKERQSKADKDNEASSEEKTDKVEIDVD